jgi:hypothetical protein
MRVTRVTRLALAVACAVGVVACPRALQAQGDALTLAEILDLRRRGVSSRQILRSAQEYCVAFAVDEAAERALVEAAGDTILVAGIRQSCVQLASGVLLDDDFTVLSALGSFTAADRLCAARPDARGLRVENRRSVVGCAIGYPLQLGDTNVRIELTIVEVHGKRGAMAALGFGKDSVSWDQYSFGVTNEDVFELCIRVGDRCQRLLSHKRTVPIRADASPGTRIAVEIRGRELSLYIDGQRVGTHSVAKPVVGSISLGVGSRSTAIFNRLRVERLDAMAAAR